MYSGDSDFVFLGGSCNPTTWRSEVAIPLLEQQLVNYYNPQVSRWYPELIEKENFAKAFASVLFFFIDNQTRSIVAMIEVAELSATHRKLVCMVNEYNQRQTVICGELVSEKELEDLKHAQKIIKNLVLRQGVPVFNNLSRAMGCVAEMIKDNPSTDQLIKDLKQNYYSKYRKFSDKIFKLKEIFRSLDVSNIGRISLIDAKYAVRAITGFDITEEVLNSIKFCQLNGLYDLSNGHSENNYDMFLNFEQFFCLIAIYDYELEKLNYKPPGKQLSVAPLKEHKRVLVANQSNNIAKPIQKVIDWFSSVKHQPNRNAGNRQSLHVKNENSMNNSMNNSINNNMNNAVRRSNSINRLTILSNDKYYTVPYGGSKFIMNQEINTMINPAGHNGNHNAYPAGHLNSGGAGDDEVDFICNSVKNNVLNSRLNIKTRSVYPFQVECRDIYLGGTCTPSKWREEIAIPLLR